MTKARTLRAFLFQTGTTGLFASGRYMSSNFQRLFFALLAIFGLAASASPGISASGYGRYSTGRETPPAMTCEPCAAFNALNTSVRDGKIARRQARDELSRLLPAISSYYYRHGGKNYDRSEWVFPLAGYTLRAINGGGRHGYEPRGYDWLDGNRHKGHPALDIFIRDRDQDERDDRTGQPVPVLSLTGGVVVALETAWEPGSGLRGGKYLWIYDPSTETLVYYAHNRELMVGLGTIVKPGDRIATVGRTGFNAHKKRSPTHLHLTLLHIGKDTLIPVDPYPILGRCHKR